MTKTKTESKTETEQITIATSRLVADPLLAMAREVEGLERQIAKRKKRVDELKARLMLQVEQGTTTVGNYEICRYHVKGHAVSYFCKPFDALKVRKV